MSVSAFSNDCGVDGVYSSPMPNEGEVAATLPRCYTSVCSGIADKGYVDLQLKQVLH